MKSLTYASPCVSAKERATINPIIYCLLITSIFSGSIQANINGDAEIRAANDPYKYADDFSLFNVRVSFAIPHWDSEIIAWSRNVFDEKYVARSGFDVPVQTGKIMAYPGASRSFGVTFRKSF
ncbi:MAG: hypothetical protein SVW51_11645 [Pseudomonadota bacterium]|nr:hypothetical protein [Pseudomonadota bacterium]